MIIGLTGATGFLGRAIIKHLVPSNQVVGLTRSADRQAAVPGVTWLDGRLEDGRAMRELAQRCDAIVHAGVFMPGDSFIGGEGDPATYFDANVTGSLKLLDAAEQCNVKKVIFISSGAVHAKVADDRDLDERHPLWPTSLYGAYKASVETLIHAYGLSGKINACSLRPTSIYGVADPPDQSKFFQLIKDVAQGNPVKPTGGGKVVHCGDVSRAVGILLATPENTSGQTYNCSDRFVSHYEVAEIAKDLTGSDSVISGSAKSSGNAMDTSKLQSLGMSFGGTERLRSVTEELVSVLRGSDA